LLFLLAFLRQEDSHFYWLNSTKAGQLDSHGLADLPSLRELTFLGLGGDTPISAPALAMLTRERYPKLTSLSLSHSSVDDSWCSELLKLDQLETIHLYATRISDVGLLELAKHRSLRKVSVGLSCVTKDGITKFVAERNDVHLDHGG
jgi:hypothetical protein